MKVKLNKELEIEVKKLILDLKSKSIEEFINNAIRDKILELKKKRIKEKVERKIDIMKLAGTWKMTDNEWDEIRESLDEERRMWKVKM